MKYLDPLFDAHDPETALVELEIHCPETTLSELVATVSQEARNEAEMIATVTALLEDVDFWYAGDDQDFSIN